MPEVPAWAQAAGLLILASLVWLALLPLWMYNRVKGIERALWAVVTQLQHMRQEHQPEDSVQRALRQREPPAPTGMISTSIFGR